MQTINIIGNVGQTPIVKVAQSGSQYVEFQVAVYVNQNETQWYQIRVFGDTKMNYVSQFVYQGSKVFVSGTPTYWVSRPDDAQPKVGISIMAQSVEGLSGKVQTTQPVPQAQPVQPQGYMNAYQTTDVTNNIQNRYPAQTYTQPLAPSQPVYQQPQQPMYQQQVAPMQPNTPPILPPINSQGVTQPQQPAAVPATQPIRF